MSHIRGENVASAAFQGKRLPRTVIVDKYRDVHCFGGAVESVVAGVLCGLWMALYLVSVRLWRWLFRRVCRR